LFLAEGNSPPLLARKMPFRGAIFFLGGALFLFIFSLILFFLANFMGLCISVALIIYALSQAFRFHFLHFQILKRNLECTPKEWAHFVKKGISDV
jgi:hypothetical protein